MGRLDASEVPVSRVLYVSHGAVSFTLQTGSPPERWMRGLAPTLRAEAPRAVVVVTPHLEGPGFTVGGAAAPRTLHDHPFTQEYGRRYPAPGDPALAARVAGLLAEAGLEAAVRPEAPLDHGAWLPLMALRPEADLPVVPLGVHGGLDAGTHLRAGAALRPLLDSGVMVVGSGGLTHDLAMFRAGWMAREDTDWAPDDSEAFEAWLARTLDGPCAGWAAALGRWREQRSARKSHPTAEHLMPLMVCAGLAAALPARATFHHLGFQHGLSMGAFTFEPAA